MQQKSEEEDEIKEEEGAPNEPTVGSEESGEAKTKGKVEGGKRKLVKKSTKPTHETPKLLIKFELDMRNKSDAIKMGRIIGRAANLKKDTIHATAKFLFEQCLAEYRANKMLD